MFYFLESSLPTALNDLSLRTCYRIVFTYVLVFTYEGDRKSECASVWFIRARTLNTYSQFFQCPIPYLEKWFSASWTILKLLLAAAADVMSVAT
jgi:hypothetical protein